MPPVDDAVVREALDRLLYLEGQRISYRNLEVEQIGSVYEALMGFEVRRALTDTVPLRGGAFVELGELAEAEHPLLFLQQVTGERNARLRKQLPELDRWAPAGDVMADRAAVAAALQPLIDPRRRAVPPGQHYLQPGSARRSSGSHYTPRSLTEPIVRHTLAPLLGEQPTVDQILDLRVCDPAMGSGAFLAEACRQLGDALARAWTREGRGPQPSADAQLVARRQVAERCLFGVDKNPRAVQLARLSLWLITSAPDLPFTFVDHNLREGDALVGLDLRQMAAFALRPPKQQEAREPEFRSAMHSAARMRGQIIKPQLGLPLGVGDYRHQRDWLRAADEEIEDERAVGDLLIASLWAGGSKAAQRRRRQQQADLAWGWYPNVDGSPPPPQAAALLDALPMRPFHWWLEFPEVFGGRRPGFDAVVGNPPFGGKNLIVAENGAQYIKLLQAFWPHAHGGADLCSYFFLRARQVLREGGGFGLVASNTIKQGNTRDTGLRHLVGERGVRLTRAVTDTPWPVAGVAVVVDIVHGQVGAAPGQAVLNGQVVGAIHSGLEAGEELPEPVKLRACNGLSFAGSKIYGQGFILTPAEAEALLAADPRRAEVLRPYLGGKELNSNVPLAADQPVPHDRYVINFGDRSLEQAEQWPELLGVVRRLVKPERDRNKREGYRRNWWRHGEHRPGLYTAIAPLERCLCGSQVSKHLVLGWQSVERVFAHTVNVFAVADWPSFAILQSRTHEVWARDLGSSMKTDLRYTPSRCFETFPFPRPAAAERAALATTGEALYSARQALMVELGEGMTKIWNRLHDPHEDHPGVLRLRALREAMDRAVLAAYGWGDLEPDDGAEVLRRLRKLNVERAAQEARGT